MVAVGSFVAGTVAIVGTQVFAPLLGAAALAFGPPEFLALMILCFILLSNLSGDSPIKGSCMFALGLWLSSIGVGPLDGVQRFSFGVDDLMLGIDFLPVAVGLFGVSEIISPAFPPMFPRFSRRSACETSTPTGRRCGVRSARSHGARSWGFSSV